jgi:catechol 2,3-dioxygenase-like lactoylglutathione lyase family enzyme
MAPTNFGTNGVLWMAQMLLRTWPRRTQGKHGVFVQSCFYGRPMFYYESARLTAWYPHPLLPGAAWAVVGHLTRRVTHQTCLHPISHMGARLFVQKGGHLLTFVQVEAKYLDVSYHRCRVGLNHLAFAVPTRPEVDDFHRALVEKQIPLLYEEKYPFAGGEDYYAVFFEDPDRMKVEVASLV